MIVLQTILIYLTALRLTDAKIATPPRRSKLFGLVVVVKEEKMLSQSVFYQDIYASMKPRFFVCTLGHTRVRAEKLIYFQLYITR